MKGADTLTTSRLKPFNYKVNSYNPKTVSTLTWRDMLMHGFLTPLSVTNTPYLSKQANSPAFPPTAQSTLGAQRGRVINTV